MADLRREGLFHGSVEQVHALLTDPEFLEADALDHDATAVEVIVDGTTVTVRTRIRTDRAPAVLAKVLPTEIGLRESITWSGVDRGDVTVSIMAGKGTMVGTVTLTPSGDGTLVAIVGKVSASVPVIGGKIAGAAAGIIGDAMDSRCELGNEWLIKKA